jgi:glycerol-3-phosphate dehydrogenase (NAD(P)+)
MASVGIIGAGAWGTALAAAAVRGGSQAIIWCREPVVAKDIARHHENKRMLPGYTLPEEVIATTDLETACKANIIVMATPAQYFREVSMQIEPFVSEDSYVVIASKGIEIESRQLLSDIAVQTLPKMSISVISGPSFADEVAAGMPTAVALAAKDETTASWLARVFNSETFRVYPNDDIVGVQMGGALKNVLAIAAGVCRGRGMGSNTHAALLTRGLTEIVRLAVAMGGKRETLYGLAGVGDIILTCGNDKSRNMKFGISLGQGESAADLLSHRHAVIEGAHTAKTVAKLAELYNVEMPICAAVNEIIEGRMSVEDVLKELLERPVKPEGED